jgi:hypothetical protein
MKIMNFKMLFQKNILLFIIIAVLLVGISMIYQPQKGKTLSLHCAGIDGIEVPCGGGGLSIVEGTPNVYYLWFDIAVTPTDTNFNYFQLMNAGTTTDLWNAVRNTATAAPKSTAVTIGNTYTFTTKNTCSSASQCGSSESCVNNQCMIATSRYDSQPQPYTFLVNMSGNYNMPPSGTRNSYQTAQLTISILPDPAGGYQVAIIPGQ